MTVIPEKGKWTGPVQVVGESVGKAAARFRRNFSVVEGDLRGHTGKMTRHESARQFRSEAAIQRRVDSELGYFDIPLLYRISVADISGVANKNKNDKDRHSWCA